MKTTSMNNKEEGGNTSDEQLQLIEWLQTENQTIKQSVWWLENENT